jgi:hypothetical protein
VSIVPVFLTTPTDSHGVLGCKKKLVPRLDVEGRVPGVHVARTMPPTRYFTGAWGARHASSFHQTGRLLHEAPHSVVTLELEFLVGPMLSVDE